MAIWCRSRSPGLFVARPRGTQVFSPQTAREVRAMLEMAVRPGGTAPKAQIPGYRVAGKTGTARKLENGRYTTKNYVASFVGFAPASDPRLIVAVMIDEPRGKYYGGQVAAPVFASVMAGTSAHARHCAGRAARGRAVRQAGGEGQVVSTMAV
jgi:cell division protein FtsI/penicillin-binding protein 2